MKHSVRKGFSFGLASGIITTLGLIVGLDSSTHSSVVVITGILIIAITDALSDAMGIHMSEESEAQHSKKEIWEATVMTFISKFFVALSFLIPVLLFQLETAIAICIVWGLALIVVFSYFMAKKGNERAYMVIIEHLTIAIIVVVLTYFVGGVIRSLLGA
jgi:VIT1/CCC1 family predicted Fe2+/Mn2+ transporter